MPLSISFRSSSSRIQVSVVHLICSTYESRPAGTGGKRAFCTFLATLPLHFLSSRKSFSLRALEAVQTDDLGSGLTVLHSIILCDGAMRGKS